MRQVCGETGCGAHTDAHPRALNHNVHEKSEKVGYVKETNIPEGRMGAVYFGKKIILYSETESKELSKIFRSNIQGF